jgi:hypothetical protein
MGPGLFAAAAAALNLLISSAGMWAQPAANDTLLVKPLVGRTVEQVVEQFGRPIEAIPLFETGGRLFVFETARGDRYIIETDVSRRVVDAAVKHPHNR